MYLKINTIENYLLYCFFLFESVVTEFKLFNFLTLLDVECVV